MTSRSVQYGARKPGLSILRLPSQRTAPHVKFPSNRQRRPRICKGRILADYCSTRSAVGGGQDHSLQGVRISRAIARANKSRLLQGLQVSSLVEERVDDEGDNACGHLPKGKMGGFEDRAQATGLIELSCLGLGVVDTSAEPFSTTIDPEASVSGTTTDTTHTQATHHRQS